MFWCVPSGIRTKGAQFVPRIAASISAQRFGADRIVLPVYRQPVEADAGHQFNHLWRGEAEPCSDARSYLTFNCCFTWFSRIPYLLSIYGVR